MRRLVTLIGPARWLRAWPPLRGGDREVVQGTRKVIVANRHSSTDGPADTQRPRRRPAPAFFPRATPAVRRCGVSSPWSSPPRVERSSWRSRSASVPSGRLAAGLTAPRLDDPLVVAPPRATLTIRLTSHCGNRGARGSSCPPFVGDLLTADQCLLDCGPDLAQVRRRGCRVDRDVDTVMALARVSPAVRSFTGIAKVTKPSRRPVPLAGRGGPPIPRVARCWSLRVSVRGRPTRRHRQRSLP